MLPLGKFVFRSTMHDDMYNDMYNDMYIVHLLDIFIVDSLFYNKKLLFFDFPDVHKLHLTLCLLLKFSPSFILSHDWVIWYWLE